MGIGLSTGDVNLNRLPGWDKGSYGYHGDDGQSFCSSGPGVAYGQTFTTGDYVGCCVNFLENSCFYTLNGVSIGKLFLNFLRTINSYFHLGTSFRDIPVNNHFYYFVFLHIFLIVFQTEIYPTIGLQTPLEALEANFGLSPFKFDIEKYMDVSKISLNRLFK
jgi:hypothetical protein